MPRAQLPLSTEYVLLGLLSRHPMHGYDLHKEIHSLEAVRMIWEIKQSSLYAMLDKLETDGLLSSELLNGGDPYPLRRQYRMTERGWQVFTAWTATPVTHARDVRQDFLARLYFAAQIGPAQAARLIEKQFAACRCWLANLENQAAQLPSGSGYEKLIFGFRIRQVQAILDWLEECKKEYTHA